jgi:hypothetical protein
VPLGDIQSGQAARIGHQMLDIPRASDSKQAHLAPVPFDRAQAPQSIVKAVAV